MRTWTEPIANVPAVKPTDHAIVWEFCFERVMGKVECYADPHDRCRWQATCDCEVYGEMGVDADGPFHTAYTEASEADALERHRMTYGGDCQVELWLDADDVGMSSERGLRFEVARTPIETRWHGDHVSWKPAGWPSR